MSTQIAVIDRGRVIQQASRGNLRTPDRRLFAAFIGHSNLLTARIRPSTRETVVVTVEGGMELTLGLPMTVKTLQPATP